MSHSKPRDLLVALLSALGSIMGCSGAEGDSSAALRGADTPMTSAQGRSIVATAVCDTVAVRWRRASVAFTRFDSVATMNSMTGSAPVCVVTAVAEDDPGMKLMSFSYWADSTNQRWRGITRWDADGPDGMSRTLARAGVRCQVDGEWDGGDDADPTAVRSKRVTERTTCWADPAGLTPRDTSTMP